MTNQRKILVLFSGGLDSLLAAKVLQEKGNQVEGVHFQNPFSTLKKEKVKKIAQQINLPLHFIELKDDYLKLIENPKHGYGKNINPCLDCRIFLLKKAWQLAQQKGFDFLATGEVIGQRPFSQRKQALELIEKESGLKGKIIRPLVDLDIKGRQRKEQLKLAQQYDLKEFLSPAGGCLLTDPAFSEKVEDVFKHKEKLSLPLISLLKLGRQQRIKGEKVVIGRNEKENQKLTSLAKKNHWWFGEIVDIPSPIGVVLDKEILKPASEIIARYSDADKGEVVICYWQQNGQKKNVKIKT